VKPKNEEDQARVTEVFRLRGPFSRNQMAVPLRERRLVEKKTKTLERSMGEKWSAFIEWEKQLCGKRVFPAG